MRLIFNQKGGESRLFSWFDAIPADGLLINMTILVCKLVQTGFARIVSRVS